MRLTIGIPTLNEERHILRTLNSIRSQLHNLDLQIEVIVIDNGSHDKTQLIVQEYIATLNRSEFDARLVINPKNLGFSFSCDELIRICSGDYLWILGAHDRLLPGSLKEIEGYLNRFNPHSLLLNATVYDEKTDTVLNQSIYKFGFVRNDENIYNVYGRESFFSELHGPCQSVSLNITASKSLKQVLNEKLETKYWGFYQRICDGVIRSDNNRFGFIQAPSVEIMLKYDGWQYIKKDTFGEKVESSTHTGFLVVMDMATLAIKRYGSHPFIQKNVGVWLDTFAIPRAIAESKFTGMRTSPKILLLSFLAFRKSLWYWFIGLPMLLIPRFVLSPRLLEICRRAVHGIRRVTGQYDKDA